MKPFFRTYFVNLDRRYACEARVFPARPAPHVGADSPRYMAPGTPGLVRILAVLVDGVWQDPADMRPETLAALQADCERQAGVRKSAVVVRESQLAFDAEEMR